MKVHNFKVSLTKDDRIQREIHILENQSFKELHHTIMKAFKLSKLSGASFFKCDSKWKKGKRIALNTPSVADEVLKMDETTVKTFVDDPDQRFVYECKTSSPWAFQLELINTEEADEEELRRYPQWDDTSNIPLSEAGKKSTSLLSDDDDFDYDDGEDDDSFGSGFEGLDVKDDDEDDLDAIDDGDDDEDDDDLLKS